MPLQQFPNFLRARNYRNRNVTMSNPTSIILVAHPTMASSPQFDRSSAPNKLTCNDGEVNIWGPKIVQFLTPTFENLGLPWSTSNFSWFTLVHVGLPHKVRRGWSPLADHGLPLSTSWVYLGLEGKPTSVAQYNDNFNVVHTLAYVGGPRSTLAEMWTKVDKHVSLPLVYPGRQTLGLLMGGTQ
ncbi:hypothetical protein C8R45DRAFT_1080710 [Mycena sanguinolenta]|nr:hypothetical protein C8R45DRAFT_1080710 [Mycena sanguinolenta]